MSTHSKQNENNDYVSITCTQTEPTVQILCKCKRSNQSKDLDSVIKVRCNEMNCIYRMDSNDNGNAGEHEWVSKETRYPDGTVKLRNPNIELMDQDILYHLALGSGSHDLVEMFGDVKFVCMGGTPKRMETFAHFIMGEIGYKLPTGTQLSDISAFSYRYSMYKVGPVLCVSHGMGVPSVGILLHEMIKLMYHAKCKDPIFIRIGTCGGIGVEGGTVIITEDAIDGLFRSTFELPILGKLVQRPAKLDKKLARELKSLCDPANDPYDTVIGKTMCANDFYEGQGRLDGAFCDYTENDKMEYLAKLHDFGVINIEMECTIFAALTYHAGIRSAIVCVALLDRLKGDQVNTPKEVMHEWQLRPQVLVSRLIRKHLALDNTLKKPLIANSSICSPRRYKLVQQESEAHE
ncbi:uridine phosphorylase 1-like isoform X1 [Contarinia nasturtii]|uniref:uridine phosphorylase 1-like isoform X1 n=1 Tax=Contarinia nasturtii TaxID=265458 RepID=UPI0012D37F22|nr:uridine phosphorylase 1-like isoform X1 [Contarinia nasturtii]XP_031633002.1 uridine phosphorylase 1-like isoform X1 [Contarinia nasturtii]